MTIEPRHNLLVLQEGTVMLLSDILSLVALIAFLGVITFAVAMIAKVLTPLTPVKHSQTARPVRYHGRSARGEGYFNDPS